MNTSPLTPFGLEVTSSPRRLDELDIAHLKSWIAEHRLVVLRGFTLGDDAEMLAFCKRLGEILEWEFGSVNELQVKPDAKNYLYTPAPVPMHWDGAFVGKVPHFIFFHCRVAPPAGSGGETTFCDTARMLTLMSDEERSARRDLRITYSTDKVVHYGGSFSAALLDRHPVHGYDVVRYAEPVADLNPVRLEMPLAEGEKEAFVKRMRELLYDTRCFRAHALREGDVAIADNHAMLHGRNAFAQPAARHLRRVNVL